MIVLVGSLSTNKNAKDAVKRGHLETDEGRNNIALILLALFILWNWLVEKFYLYEALKGIYLDYYWNISKNSIKNLEEYILYATKNIFQIKKIQQDAKLNRDLRNAAKNLIIEPDIFDSNDSNDYNVKEDLEEENGENLELPISNSYS